MMLPWNPASGKTPNRSTRLRVKSACCCEVMGRGTLNTNEAVCVDLSEEADLWPLSLCSYFSV